MATTETSESSEVSLYLTRARELIDRGKQKRALDQLWHAEAFASGNAEALQGVLDVAASSEQSDGFAELVKALENDIEKASGSDVRAKSPGSIGESGRTVSLRGPTVAGALAALSAAGSSVYVGVSTWGLMEDCSGTGGFGTLGMWVFGLGLILFLAVLICHWWARALAVVLTLGAGLLASAIGILASESATYTQRCLDLWGGQRYTRPLYLGYLYVPWGIAVATLLLAAAVVVDRMVRGPRAWKIITPIEQPDAETAPVSANPRRSSNQQGTCRTSASGR